jgi:hypothetical protein
MTAGLRACIADPERAAAEGMTAEQMEELFLTLR